MPLSFLFPQPQKPASYRKHLVWLLFFAVLILDQSLKIWVKTHFTLSEEMLLIGDWLRIHFMENPGMAFGQFSGGSWVGIGIGIVRLIALLGLILVYRHFSKKNAPFGLLAGLVLILAGATGNMIDRCFYGLMFSGSAHGVAEFFPEHGGYGHFLSGKVVDMIYLPVYQGFVPDWIPLVGGKYIQFFQSIFNIADLAITMGILLLVVRFRKYFS